MKTFCAIFLFILAVSVPFSALGETANDVQGLIGQLGSPDGRVRSQARFALVSMGKNAVPGLIDALKGGKDLVEVVYCLNAIKDSRAAGPLAALLDTRDQEALSKVESALYALGEVSVPYLFDAMGDPARCEAAARVLKPMKDPARLERLRKALKEKDPAARACAAEVELAWLDLEASGPMAGLLQDENERTRERASGYFLALYKDLDTPHIEILLADKDPVVRRNAVEITIRKKDESQAVRLAAMLGGDPDEDVRRLAADSLAKCCPDKAVGPLTEALDDKSDAVASAAAWHLGELKAASAQAKLAGLLPEREKPSDALVENVALALAKIGGSYDANVLLPYINWDNLYVVRAVIRAWEISATPSDTKIKDALRRYLDMPVDGRYKEHVKKLLEKLG